MSDLILSDKARAIREAFSEIADEEELEKFFTKNWNMFGAGAVEEIYSSISLNIDRTMLYIDITADLKNQLLDVEYTKEDFFQNVPGSGIRFVLRWIHHNDLRFNTAHRSVVSYLIVPFDVAPTLSGYYLLTGGRYAEV